MEGRKVVVWLPNSFGEKLNARADANCRMVEEEARAILQQALDAPSIPEVPSGPRAELLALHALLDHQDTDLARARNTAHGPQKRGGPLDEIEYARALGGLRVVRRTLEVIDALLGIDPTQFDSKHMHRG